MFSALNPQELDIVLGAMQEVNKKAGDLVIREGDDGNELYLVDSGKLKCTKVLVSLNKSLNIIERGRGPHPA